MEYQTLNQLYQAGIANLRNRSLGALYMSIHGAASETTLRRNQAALARQAFRPHAVLLSRTAWGRNAWRASAA